MPRLYFVCILGLYKIMLIKKTLETKLETKYQIGNTRILGGKALVTTE
jgi:hypothetical protein